MSLSSAVARSLEGCELFDIWRYRPEIKEGFQISRLFNYVQGKRQNIGRWRRDWRYEENTLTD